MHFYFWGNWCKRCCSSGFHMGSLTIGCLPWRVCFPPLTFLNSGVRGSAYFTRAIRIRPKSSSIMSLYSTLEYLESKTYMGAVGHHTKAKETAGLQILTRRGGAYLLMCVLLSAFSNEQVAGLPGFWCLNLTKSAA